MKNKNKKQEDEGSTQSNASRYDPYTFLPCSYLWLFTLSSLVDHLCIRLQRGFVESAPLSWMTLLLFNSHTLIFVSFLALNTGVSGLLLHCPQHYVLDHRKSNLSCIMLHMICHKCFMSHRFKVIWPCLTSWYCIAPFKQRCCLVFISETMCCFGVSYDYQYTWSFRSVIYIYIHFVVTSITWIQFTRGYFILFWSFIRGLYKWIWPIVLGKF